ncbi:hypothetical protein MMC20_005028 [Loxospora ochrophaea]|nr:hypothetical protein [Loxospora ochrophaea]
MDPASIVLPPGAPTTSSADRLTIASLKQSLEHAIEARGKRYDWIETFAIRFADDDTRAVNDTANFQSLLQMIGLPAAREQVVPANSVIPRWDFSPPIRSAISTAMTTQGRGLAIGHYAGHGGLKDGQLVFKAQIEALKEVSFDLTFGELWTETGVAENLDVLIILDCCYSGAAIRQTPTGSRSVEIIASVSASQTAFGNNSRLARIQAKTFTSRLADEVSMALGVPLTTSIAMTDIIGAMKPKASPDRMPQYQLLRGTVAIRLPVRLPPHRLPPQARHRPSSSGSFASPSTSSTPPPNQPSSNYAAIFCAHVNSVDVAHGEHTALLQWINSLHPSVELELLGVYLTNSMTLMFHSRWSTWAVLQGRSGFRLVLETRGRNRLQELVHPSLAPTRKENVPPQGGK